MKLKAYVPKDRQKVEEVALFAVVEYYDEPTLARVDENGEVVECIAYLRENEGVDLLGGRTASCGLPVERDGMAKVTR